jgi:DUF4097 and DUF4098 domain-containing protein YvlB
MKVLMRKRAYSKARLDGIAINIAVEGDKASIDTVYPPAPKGLSVADRSGTVDFLITIPETCSVSPVEVATGEIIVEGFRGRTVNARLTNGRMMMRNCFSDIHLAVGSGGLDIFYDWWEALRFPLVAEIGNGHIRMQLPSYASLRLEAVSGNGSVINGFAKEGEPSQTVNTIIGSGDGAEFKLRASSGNILIQNIP